MPEPLNAIRKPNIARFALATAVLYAALGLVWILASDWLVTSISDDPAWVSAAQRYKGIFYVLGTSLGLFFMVNLGYLRLSTARQRADATELQVQDLFLQHPKPMWVYDHETLEFMVVNEAATHFYGYSHDEFLAMTLADLSAGPELPETSAFLQSPPDGHRDIGVLRQRKKSGEVVFAHLTAHSVALSQRKAVMVMAIDVTADILSKAALERQEAQFRQLHQSLADVLWMASADGRNVLYASPALERVYGFTQAQMKANPDLWLQAVHPDDRPIAEASHTRLLSVGESSCEYRILPLSGGTKWVLDRKRLIVDTEGLVTMMGGILEDVTAAKELESLRAATHGELERLVTVRTAELVRVNDELDAYARTVAHDLRSPLVSVVGFTQLLQKRYGAVLQEDGARLTARIERSAKQMATLVTDLLALSRVATTVLTIQDLDLVPLAREILEDLQEQEPQRHVRIELPPAMPVQADPGLMRPLLRNLIGNAWKFTSKRDDACIRLRMDVQATEVIFQVQDNGAGFDAGNTALLFKPFQRFHSLSEFGGTGIGLTTCERIMARHQGRIWVESAPGSGTSVFVAFRRADAASR